MIWKRKKKTDLEISIERSVHAAFRPLGFFLLGMILAAILINIGGYQMAAGMADVCRKYPQMGNAAMYNIMAHISIGFITLLCLLFVYQIYDLCRFLPRKEK